MTNVVESKNPAAAVRSVLAVLQLRKTTADRELSSAIAGAQWSKLVGLQGIREGLAAAARHLASEQAAIADFKGLQALAARFEVNAKECDDMRHVALLSQRFADVAAHDGVGTGWLIAKKVIDDELASVPGLRRR